jgi:hypothetical protein
VRRKEIGCGSHSPVPTVTIENPLFSVNWRAGRLHLFHVPFGPHFLLALAPNESEFVVVPVGRRTAAAPSIHQPPQPPGHRATFARPDALFQQGPRGSRGPLHVTDLCMAADPHRTQKKRSRARGAFPLHSIPLGPPRQALIRNRANTRRKAGAATLPFPMAAP